MTYSREEAQKVANDLVEATIKLKELQSAIKDYKAGLLEFAEVENINDTSWAAQNGYVELTTVTKRELMDIPAEPQVSPSVMDPDMVKELFDVNLKLNKQGRKLLKNQDPDLMALMISSLKPNIKVILKVDPSQTQQ